MQDWKMADRRNHGGGKCKTDKIMSDKIARLKFDELAMCVGV